MGMFSNQDYKRAFGAQYRPGRVTGLDEMVRRGEISHMDKERIKLAKNVDELKFIRGKQAVRAGIKPAGPVVSRPPTKSPEKPKY